MLYTMKELRERLGDRRLTVVAQATGIAYDRLWRLMTAKQEATESDLAALTAYVERPAA
jgi:hypothetical protein